MSRPRATGAAAVAALLLSCFTPSCGGGHSPPRAASGPGEIDLTRSGTTAGSAEPVPLGDPSVAPDSSAAIRFEDLPVTRLERGKVPPPNGANPSLGAHDAKVVL